jgi:hypothetical protein
MIPTRSWSPQQAGYDAATMVVTTTRPDTPETPGLPVDFIRTRHGTVARVWLGHDLTEVTIRRPRNVRPTFQGTVRRISGGWSGFDPDGQQVTGIHANYLDAEAPMLLLRTGRRAASTFPWPHRITRR